MKAQAQARVRQIAAQSRVDVGFIGVEEREAGNSRLTLVQEGILPSEVEQLRQASKQGSESPGGDRASRLTVHRRVPPVGIRDCSLLGDAGA